MNISYLNKLRNQTFPVAYASILSTLEESVITEEYLTECLELANAKQDELGFLENKRAKHPLTKIISELIKDRHDYFLSLKGSVTNALKSPIQANREAAKLLAAWLERYQEYLKTPRMYEQTNLMNQLNQDIERYDNISEGMATLNQVEVFDSIKLITREIQQKLRERSKDRQSQTRMVNVLRREALEALKTLMNALDMAIKLNSENSTIYLGYWNEIVRTLDEFNAKALSRRTRKRNTAEKNEQPVDTEVDGEMDDVPEGDTEMTPPAPKTTTAMRSRPYNVLRLNESMDMDLQTVEKAHEDWDATNDAMNGSGTINNNDVTTTNGSDTAKADDATADNKAMDDAATDNSEQTSSAEETSPAESDTKAHNGATSEDLNN